MTCNVIAIKLVLVLIFTVSFSISECTPLSGSQRASRFNFKSNPVQPFPYRDHPFHPHPRPRPPIPKQRPNNLKMNANNADMLKSFNVEHMSMLDVNDPVPERASVRISHFDLLSGVHLSCTFLLLPVQGYGTKLSI